MQGPNVTGYQQQPVPMQQTPQQYMPTTQPYMQMPQQFSQQAAPAGGMYQGTNQMQQYPQQHPMTAPNMQQMMLPPSQAGAAPQQQPMHGSMGLPGAMPAGMPDATPHQGHLPAPVVSRAPRSFNTGLCACCSDCKVCCCGWCCLCCLYGDTHNRIHGNGFWMPCCMYLFCNCCKCIFAGSLRKTIRMKYNLHEEPCSDCCVHCWCSALAVCQEARELKLR